jgi:hypothetical protein
MAGMNKTFNPPPPGSNRLPTSVKTLLVIVFVSSAMWMALCIFAVSWMSKGASKYDYSARPMTDLELQTWREGKGDRPAPQQ